MTISLYNRDNTAQLVTFDAAIKWVEIDPSGTVHIWHDAYELMDLHRFGTRFLCDIKPDVAVCE